MQRHEVMPPMMPRPSDSTAQTQPVDPLVVDNLDGVDPQLAVGPSSMKIEDPPPSFVKLAMRNMVRKSGQSLRHFGLTVVGLLALLVGLAYLTR